MTGCQTFSDFTGGSRQTESSAIQTENRNLIRLTKGYWPPYVTHWISQKPNTNQEFVFFYREEDEFIWKTLEDLKGLTIGVTAGYVYGDNFFSNLENPDYIFLESIFDNANFHMLLAHRIDIFIMEKEVGFYIIDEMFSKDEQELITYSLKPISEFKSYLLLSKAIPENEVRIKEYDQGFRTLINTGRYDEIFLQWNRMGG